MSAAELLPLAASSAAVVCLLWAPIFLWLILWIPPAESLWLHLGTATVLALLCAAPLRKGFLLPRASPGPGRYRVLPSSPHRPLLVAATALASLGWGSWQLAVGGADGLALIALFGGCTGMWLALRARADPLWGTWMEVAGEVLRVHCPRAADWSVPLAQARALHRRPQDGSFFLETPWPARDVFVPSRRARARYHVSDHAELFDRLAERVPVEETPVLLRVLRRSARARERVGAG